MCTRKDPVIRVHNRLAIAVSSACEVRMLLRERNNVHIYDAEGQCPSTGSGFAPVPIAHIGQFVSKMHRVLHDNPAKTVVICVGSDSSESITTIALLLGGFMILGQGIGFEEVMLSFKALSSRFVPHKGGNLSVQDCWRALCHAKCLGWIDLTRESLPSDEVLYLGTLDLEAHEHYSTAANGSIFVIVPNKLLVFASPEDLPENRQWMDFSGVANRRFSPSYFADLLSSEFEVSLVASLDQVIYDKAAFTKKGIEVKDALLDDDDSHIVHAIHHFLSAAASTPGAAALHAGPPDASQHIGTLAAAYLINRLNFETRCAVAWLCMVHPNLRVVEHQSFLIDHQHRFAYLSKPGASSAAVVGRTIAARWDCAASAAAPPSTLPRSASLDCLSAVAEGAAVATSGPGKCGGISRCASQPDALSALADDIFELSLNRS